MSPATYVVPVAQVTLIPLVLTAVIVFPLTLLTVSVRSLAGLRPPRLVPKILIVSLRL